MNQLEYASIKDIIKKYPFTLGQIRALLIKRDINGLWKCVRKIGRRVYFRLDLFEKWIENQKE